MAAMVVVQILMAAVAGSQERMLRVLVEVQSLRLRSAFVVALEDVGGSDQSLEPAKEKVRQACQRMKGPHHAGLAERRGREVEVLAVELQLAEGRVIAATDRTCLQ